MLLLDLRGFEGGVGLVRVVTPCFYEWVFRRRFFFILLDAVGYYIQSAEMRECVYVTLNISIS